MQIIVTSCATKRIIEIEGLGTLFSEVAQLLPISEGNRHDLLYELRNTNNWSFEPDKDEDYPFLFDRMRSEGWSVHLVCATEARRHWELEKVA